MKSRRQSVRASCVNHARNASPLRKGRKTRRDTASWIPVPAKVKDKSEGLRSGGQDPIGSEAKNNSL